MSTAPRTNASSGVSASSSSASGAAGQANLKPIQVKLFQENKEPTIGAAFLTQKCKLDDKIIKFEIWDTAGQERFHSLAPMYYRNAQAAVVAYDITKPASLEKAKAWVKELQRQANPNIVIALVGNKLDLAATARGVSTEEAQAYATEGGLLFLEASAKTGEFVVNIFTDIAKKIPLESLAASRSRTGLTNGGNGSGSAGGNANNGRVDLNSNHNATASQDSCAC
ncbi:hypothetical protein BSLG_006911 [Batrachochytrium salamandrivorans]|nr:hypothetical protein BSLG_006911 [Batrachochytrium salamandrivorans]